MRIRREWQTIAFGAGCGGHDITVSSDGRACLRGAKEN